MFTLHFPIHVCVWACALRPEEGALGSAFLSWQSLAQAQVLSLCVRCLSLAVALPPPAKLCRKGLPAARMAACLLAQPSARREAMKSPPLRPGNAIKCAAPALNGSARADAGWQAS